MKWNRNRFSYSQSVRISLDLNLNLKKLTWKVICWHKPCTAQTELHKVISKVWFNVLIGLQEDFLPDDSQLTIFLHTETITRVSVRVTISAWATEHTPTSNLWTQSWTGRERLHEKNIKCDFKWRDDANWKCESIWKVFIYIHQYPIHILVWGESISISSLEYITKSYLKI